MTSHNDCQSSSKTCKYISTTAAHWTINFSKQLPDRGGQETLLSCGHSSKPLIISNPMFSGFKCNLLFLRHLICQHVGRLYFVSSLSCCSQIWTVNDLFPQTLFLLHHPRLKRHVWVGGVDSGLGKTTVESYHGSSLFCNLPLPQLWRKSRQTEYMLQSNSMQLIGKLAIAVP